MDTFSKQILELIRKMQKAMKNKMPKKHFFKIGASNLTISQIEILDYLFEHKKAKMSDLAKNAGVKMPTITELVDKLLQCGFVVREHDENDRRCVWISISKNVEKMVNFHIKKRNDDITKMMKVLSEDEKKQAVVILQKIVNSLERME
jgi:DNA-binding MarR family transcriptional regulator